MMCYFNTCDPLVRLKLLRTYCCDFYGYMCCRFVTPCLSSKITVVNFVTYHVVYFSTVGWAV